MPPAFTLVGKPTFRDIRGRFAAGTKGTLAKMKAEVAGEGERLLDLMRDEAPQKTGAFAGELDLRVKASGAANTISLEITAPQPLARFIIGGTRNHLITPSKKQALFWEGLDHPVAFASHPGTSPNPFVGRAYRRWLPGARATLNAIGKNWAADVKAALK